MTVSNEIVEALVLFIFPKDRVAWKGTGALVSPVAVLE